MNPKQKRSASTNDLMRYAGLGTQILVSLGIAVFAGYKIDSWLKISLPLLVWLLPLLVLIVMMYKLINVTSKKKDGPKQI